MKKFLVGVVALFALVSMTAQADQVSGTNAANSASNSGSAASNAGNQQAINFISPGDTNQAVHYSGQYTVKQNASIGLGSAAPSMSGYNCAASAQAGSSQAQSGLTAVLGFPVLLDPGKICVDLTLGNMHLQMAEAIAPIDKELAMKHIRAQQNLMCDVGDVYEQTRKSQRDAGLDCPLTSDEKKLADREATRDAKALEPGQTYAANPDPMLLDKICGEDNVQCVEDVKKRMAWKIAAIQYEQNPTAVAQGVSSSTSTMASNSGAIEFAYKH